MIFCHAKILIFNIVTTNKSVIFLLQKCFLSDSFNDRVKIDVSRDDYDDSKTIMLT